MSKQITITIQDWILEEVIGNSKNRSARIEELILKGYMAQQKKEETLVSMAVQPKRTEWDLTPQSVNAFQMLNLI